VSKSIRTRIKPATLQIGDTIGIVAPASPIKKDLLEAGCKILREFGYQPFYLPSILDQDIYFAGTAQRRMRELQEMFERDEVKAIICARGGYGSNYLLEHFDIEIVRKHPKIFVGYSDVTTLMTWFMDQANLITFHGPMVAKDFAVENGVAQEYWISALGGADSLEFHFSGSGGEVKTIATGRCEGVLYGGCLSMLVASLGTPYEIDTADTVLFVEDLATKPYQIDRMFMHLKLAGKLKSVRGIIFGEMLDCAQPGATNYTLETILRRLVADLNIPVIYGLRSGHVSCRNITLPLGIRVALSAEPYEVRLNFLESATAPAVVTARASKS
jgi:muramoyltetrapeptide carboxypeptidase